MLFDFCENESKELFKTNITIIYLIPPFLQAKNNTEIIFADSILRLF